MVILYLINQFNIEDTQNDKIYTMKWVNIHCHVLLLMSITSSLNIWNTACFSDSDQ